MVPLNFDMPVDRVYANSAVKPAFGQVVLHRGPAVYCIVSVEDDIARHRFKLQRRSDITARFGSGLFGGAMARQVSTLRTESTGRKNRPYGSAPPQ